jgi:hypothetical protein
MKVYHGSYTEIDVIDLAKCEGKHRVVFITLAGNLRNAETRIEFIKVKY